MRLQQVFAAMAFVTFLGAGPVMSEGRPFPGKGEQAKWEQASVPFDQGVAFYRAGNYAKAIEKYKAAIAIYPHDYDFYNNLGLTYKKNNELDLAAEALKKSIELKPNVWESWSNLGSVYKHQKKSKEAVEAFTKALEYNPPANRKALIMQNLSAMKAAMAESASASPAASGAAPAPAHSATPTATPTSLTTPEPIPIAH
ncbi:hypothetical protein BH10CYA1_BH10CYA1_07940 [soil metagenome]